MRLIIDESISDAELEIFRNFVKSHSIPFDDLFLIKDAYPGIPDSHILD